MSRWTTNPWTTNPWTDESMNERRAHTNDIHGHHHEHIRRRRHWQTPLAPGAFIVHTSMETLFAEGVVDRGEGLEALAEDGDPSTLVASLGALATVSVSEHSPPPMGQTSRDPHFPGRATASPSKQRPATISRSQPCSCSQTIGSSQRPSSGISLFDGEAPLDGDITDLVYLWDAGTEVDETPGQGENQAPRQARQTQAKPRAQSSQPLTAMQARSPLS